MKKKLLAILMTVLTLFTMTFSSGCVLIADTILTSVQLPLEITQDAEMTVNYNETTGKYDVKVEGIITNTWKKEVLQGTVVVLFYDENGHSLASARTTIGELAANATWRFIASVSIDAAPVEFKITEKFGYGWEKITKK